MQSLRFHQATTAASGANGYQELRAETYLKETFWKSVPAEADAKLWEDDAVASAAPPSRLVSLNHAALGVQDVEGMIKCALSCMSWTSCKRYMFNTVLSCVAHACRFYTRVLGMQQLARPPFPFGGAWLQGGGLMLHLIDNDPTIPRKSEYTWKVCYYFSLMGYAVVCLCLLPNWKCCAHRTSLMWTALSPGSSGEGRTRVRIKF